MSENTITIPADLWEPSFSTAELFDGLDESLRSCECGHEITRTLLRNLRREIERQAPRPEGWYHLKSNAVQHVFWWDGSDWFAGPYVDAPRARVSDGYTITPVTIGGAS